MSLSPLPASRAKSDRRRAPEGRTAGLILLGANVIGFALAGGMAVHETGVVRVLGCAATVPDQTPAEEQPPSAANATAAPESGGPGWGRTA